MTNELQDPAEPKHVETRTETVTEPALENPSEPKRVTKRTETVTEPVSGDSDS